MQHTFAELLQERLCELIQNLFVYYVLGPGNNDQSGKSRLATSSVLFFRLNESNDS